MAAEHKIEKQYRFCPYCGEEVAEASYLYCDACNVGILHCPKTKNPCHGIRCYVLVFSVGKFIRVAYEIGVELVDCITTSEVIGIFVEKNSFRSEIDILSGATYFF